MKHKVVSQKNVVGLQDIPQGIQQTIRKGRKGREGSDQDLFFQVIVHALRN